VKNHYSLFTVHFLLFIGTVHYAFSAYLRGDVPYVKTQNFFFQKFSLEHFFEREFLCFHLRISYYFPTNLVTKTSSKPCTVELLKSCNYYCYKYCYLFSIITTFSFVFIIFVVTALLDGFTLFSI